MARERILITLLFLFNWSFTQAELKTRRFYKPCFEEDKERELNFCSDPKNDCTVDELIRKDKKLKLYRIDGVKVSQSTYYDI